MKRRLFLSGSAGAALTLAGCGGGGGASPDGTAGALAGTGSDGTVVAGVATADAASPQAQAPSQAADQGSQAPAQSPAETSSPATGSGGSFPSRVLACYFTGWDSSYPLTSVPMDFNVIYLFNAQNGGTNTGDGSWNWTFGDNVTAAQIQLVRQRGQKVILTVGGAGLGFSYTNRSQSTNCVNSLKSIIAGLGGIDGVDFNNYEAGIGTSPTEMVWIAQQLIAAYGPDFAITTPPNPNSASDLALCQAMANAGVLTYAAPQFYDWSGFNEAGYISSGIGKWVDALGASRTAIGLSANYSNGPALADCIREWNAAKAMYPALRGMFCWNAQTNIAGGNQWGSRMKSLL